MEKVDSIRRCGRISMTDLLPLRFPDEADKIHQQTQEFRQLSSTQRFLAMVDLIVSGSRMLAESPNRQESERQRQVEKTRWRQAHRKLFARHGF